jgi:hypothetical protein
MVTVMVNRNLVGRCGIYCGSCIIYRAYKDSEQLRQRVAERNNCEPGEIRCEGCQTVLTNGWNSQEWGKNCRIVKCLEAKGLDFCYECDIYPNCKEFRALADHSLKYGESLAENLEKIKASEVEEWLEEEAEKWKCLKCGKPISRHLTECHWCGAKIGKEKQSNNGSSTGA